MAKKGDKYNILDLTETQRTKYERYLIGKRLASRLLRTYSVKEACRVAGIAGM